MKALLTFVSAICSLAAVATSYDWVGGASTIWNLTDANWTTDGGQTKCAFVAGGDAVFNLNDASIALTFGGAQVKPATVSVTAAAGKTLTLNYESTGSQIFSTTTLVNKKGTGTLSITSSGGTGNFPSGSVLEIEQGVVVLNTRNKGGQCAPTSIDIGRGTTLQLANANTLGNPGALSPTSVRTAGQMLFDGTVGDYANVIKDLTLEPGATFVAKKAGNSYFNGLLQIQEKVIVEGDGKGARTMTLSTPTTASYQHFSADAHAPLEFEIGDATASSAVDLTVTGPFAFVAEKKSGNGTGTGAAPVGFRKTGDGTMLWQNSYADGNAVLNGTVGVEAGTLLFAAGQTIANATVSVAAGAAVGGSGTLAKLTLAAGAGIVAQKDQAAALSVSGDLTLPTGGFVDFVADETLPGGTYVVPVLNVSGALTGDVSGWKVRVNGVETDAGKLTLSGGNLSVEVRVVLPGYVWTGAESKVWDLTSANWTADGGSTSCAFVSGADACFTTAADETVSVATPVNPNAVFVSNAVGTLTIDLRSGGANTFALTKSVVKQGAGTLYAIGAGGTANFPGEAVLDIREGVMKISCRNKGGECSPHNIVIGSGATLQVAEANTLGNLGALSPTSVRTAGAMLFDGTANDYGNVLKNLTVEPGATFVAKKGGHSYFNGLLQIQEKVIVEGDGMGARTLALSTPVTANYQRFVADARKPVEFSVGDATDSPETDLTVTGPFEFYPADISGTKTGSTTTGFRKTGAGTMLWQNSYADGNARLNGTVGVEAGTLLFAVGQTIANATVSVAAGAAVGGGARIGHLTLAEGARLCGQSGQLKALTVMGDVVLPQMLTVEVSTEDGMEPAAGFFARVLSVRGSLACGGLSGWTLKVNGIERTDIPFYLKNGEILVGQAECVWTGAQNSVWDLMTENWTRDGVNACAFMSGLTASFLGDKSETITFGAAVNPAAVCVSNAAGTLTFDYLQDPDKQPFGQTMSVVKRGAGTLSFYRKDKTNGSGGFPEGSALDLQEGTVIADTRNFANKGCLPRQIVVHGGTTFQIANGNTVGNLGALSPISVRTAGCVLFAPDPAKPADNFANAIKDLTVEPGATFVAEGAGNAYFNGLLQIQEKVIVEGDGMGARTLALSTPVTANYQRFVADARKPVEFSVSDATASPATDLTVTGPYAFVAEDKSGPTPVSTTVGFRKTGEGTMLWQNSYADGNAVLNGTVGVEGGTLLFAAGQTLVHATVVVSAGAAVGGGSVAGLTLAEGSGLVVASRRKGLLTVAGAVTIPATGKIILDIPEGMDISEFYGYFLKAPSYAGVENLKNWTLVAPGYEGPLPKDFTIIQTDKGLCFGRIPGMAIIVR